MVDRFRILYVLVTVALLVLTVPAMCIVATAGLRNVSLATLALYLILLTVVTTLLTALFIVDHLDDLLAKRRKQAEFLEKIRNETVRVVRERMRKNANVSVREILCNILLSEAEHSLEEAFRVFETFMRRKSETMDETCCRSHS